MTETTHDAFLGGKLHLLQPKRGYRAGVDPVLLAAAVPARSGQSVLDLGCGVGAAALCLGARVAGLDLTGVERNPIYAELAHRNGLPVVEADLAALPPELRNRSFDHVIANPPYFDRGRSTASEEQSREDALGIDTPLDVWVDVAARRLKPKGYFHMIHRAEALPDLLRLTSARLGSVEVLPLVPRAERDAELIILRARKEGRAKFRLVSPVVLHSGMHHFRDADDYTPLISMVLRNGAPLWPQK